MFIRDVKTDATANDRRQQRSRNESRDREGEKSSFHFVIVFKVKLNSRSRFSLPLRGGAREGESGKHGAWRARPCIALCPIEEPE